MKTATKALFYRLPFENLLGLHDNDLRIEACVVIGAAEYHVHGRAVAASVLYAGRASIQQRELIICDLSSRCCWSLLAADDKLVVRRPASQPEVLRG